MGGSITNTAGRQRREGKVRPLQGNSPHDRPVSRGTISSLRRICDDPFHATPFPLQRTILRRPVCVFQAWRNLSGPMWFQNQNQTPGRDRAASRWTAPSPGKRTRREDRAPSHRPQMSSGRLFLDRVARQQSPSPLHRQPQHNTHSSADQAKGDISTLPGRGHFYFALTDRALALDVTVLALYHSQNVWGKGKDVFDQNYVASVGLPGRIGLGTE